MQFTPDRMGRIIKRYRHEYPLVTCIIHRLRKSGVVDIVGAAPWEVGIMRPRLDDIMLEILLMDQDQSLPIRDVHKSFQSIPVPLVVFGQIIFTQSVPGRSVSRSGKRQFVKRRPDITIHPAHTLVIITATIVPESVMLLNADGIG